jgi:hypothetical protein
MINWFVRFSSERNLHEKKPVGSEFPNQSKHHNRSFDQSKPEETLGRRATGLKKEEEGVRGTRRTKRLSSMSAEPPKE